jgi:adenylate cyclase
MTAAESTDALGRGLAREVLASEILRGRVLAIALAAIATVVTCAFLVADVAIRPYVLRMPPWWLPAAVGGPFVLYECVFIAAMTAFARRGRSPPAFAKYGNALVETSFPSVVLLVASRYAEPAVVFGGWPSFFYFVFILAATLRLNVALPVFTGVVAAVEYMAVAAYVLPLSSAAGQATMTPLFHGGRAGIMVLAGVVAGLVAARLRANLVRVLEEGAARERVTNLFGQHVSPAVVDRLLEGETAAAAEARPVCVMFLDFRDFTRFARDAPAPADLTWFSWTKLIEIIGLERKPEDAEEAIQRGADRHQAAADRCPCGAGADRRPGLQGGGDFGAELLPVAQRVWRARD